MRVPPPPTSAGRTEILRPYSQTDPVDHDVVAETRDARVRRFRELWEGKCDGQRLPARADFAVEELMPWFGHIIIMDAVDEGRDFRYRLIGTGITEFLDRDYTGKLVSQCDYASADRGRDKVIETFRRPLLVRAPVYRSGHVVWAADKTWRTYDSVHCPLTRDTGAPEMTIGVLYFGVVAVPDPTS